MSKKIISMMIIFAMLVPFSSAVAADETTSQPTIEEILNGYHEKAFAAQTAEENGGAATYARRSGAEKTLEQETVDELTAAGYEAYNVTAENYEMLEETLKTDFAEMGLNPDGSYIIVISGEEETAGANSSRSSDTLLPPHTEDEAGYGGDGSFIYEYNDATYRMRYMTVTAADNNQLGMTSYIDLLDEYDVNDMWDGLNVPVTIASSLPGFTLVGTVYSLFSLVPEVEIDQFSTLLYQGGTNWTIKYIQVYDSVSKSWNNRSSAEYVTMTYFTNSTYYDASTNKYKQDNTEGTFPILYSEYYNDSTKLKDMAALCQENYGVWFDTIDEVEYRFGGKTLITHQRPMV